MTTHHKGSCFFTRGGDRISFEQIYAEHWKILCSIGNKITCDQNVTKDLVQDVFLSFLKRYEGKEIENVSAYLVQALRYECFQWLRNGKIVNRHVLRMKRVLAENNTENEVNATLLAEQVADVVSRMPARPKQVFVLSRMENISNDEIAEKLNINQRTVENHLTKALQMLRASLKITPVMLSITRYFF